jgi:23S rRNA (uracil1939-C5)-methyltransferase
MPQQGDLVEIEITDIGDGGEGVGRAGALVVFVPDTVTGDRIVARLVRQRDSTPVNYPLAPSSHAQLHRRRQVRRLSDAAR